MWLQKTWQSIKKMKTLFLFLSLFAGFTTFCQTNEQELKSNDWYLDHVVINGNTETPAVNQDFPFILLNFNTNDLLVSTYCNSVFGGVEIHENSYIFLTGPYQTLQVCDAPPGIMSFEYMYFNFFFSDYTQPFYYEIVTQPTGSKTLTITSASGDTAVYSNIALSIKEKSDFGFKLYPNPAKDAVHIQTDGSIKINQVIIYNMMGKIVSTYSELDIYDISVLQKGVYFVKIKTDQGIMNQKIIKE